MRGENNILYRGGTLKAKDYGKNWYSIKSAILKRDNYMCRVCGSTKKRLEVHHIIKLRLFYGETEKANDKNNLISLCVKCHKAVEAGKIFINAAISEYL
jgi:5-methylcytosine-specific restriction endonuclease McrA